MDINKPQLKKREIDIKNTTQVICEGCKGIAFQSAVMLRKESALMSPDGKVTFIQIPCVVCAECGQISKELLPEELRSGLTLPTV
jgi:hypothetical protein